MRVHVHSVRIFLCALVSLGAACGSSGEDAADSASAADTDTSDAAISDVSAVDTTSTVVDTSAPEDSATDASDVTGDSGATADVADAAVDTSAPEDSAAIDDVVAATLGCRVIMPPAKAYPEVLAAEVDITVPGVTDRSTGVDDDEDIIVQLGRWTIASVSYDETLAATPIAGWDRINEDGYSFDLELSDNLGSVSYGARLSIDGGDTWLVCDGIGTVTVVADPCATNPCTVPAATCDDTSAMSYPGPATCTRGAPAEATHTCDPGLATRVDCGADFQICMSGQCTAPAVSCNLQAPSAVTLFGDQSVMAYARLSIEGVTSRTDGNDLGPGIAVQWSLGDSWQAALPNSGWSASQAGVAGVDEWQAEIPAPDLPSISSYRFRVSADAGETWTTCSGVGTLTVIASPCDTHPCGDTIPAPICVDDVVVSYAAPATCVRPAQAGDAASCVPPSGTTSACGEDSRCHDGACASPDVWCRLQSPTTVSLYPDERATTYTRVYVEGLTPALDQLEPPDYVQVQAGLAPASSDPLFVWQDALPNPGWTGAGEPNNLEWLADVHAPASPGTYLYAFRVSVDSGSSWISCDGNGGLGHDGAEDGFQPERAGVMTVVADPCAAPTACTAAPSGCDGQTLVTYTATAICNRPVAHSGPAACDYGNATRSDCAALGEQCDATRLQCVLDDPCDPSPCTTPPAKTCDGNTAVSYAAPVSCAGGQCSWTTTRTACGDGQVCDAGTCRAPHTFCRLQYPQRATRYASNDSLRTYGRFYIEGLTDKTNRNDPATPPLSVKFQLGEAIFVSATDPSDDNWQWQDAAPNPAYVALDEPNNDEWMADFDQDRFFDYDYRYIYRLSIDGGQSWQYCDYNFGPGHDGSEDGFSEGNAGYVQLVQDPCTVPGACSTPPLACEADTLVTYPATPACTRPATAIVGQPPSCDYGAPARSDCASDGHYCDAQRHACWRHPPWCRLQYPPAVSLLPDESATAYARVYLAGITSATTHNDANTNLEVQLGVGADGSLPAGWTDWIAAAPNASWDGAAAGEPNNDEYQASLHGGPIATLAYAFRARWKGGDGSADWVYCDRDSGAGMDGAEDGYDTTHAGTLTRLGDPCAVNPCTSPPPGTCSGNVLTPKKAPGVCTAVDHQAHCEYPEDDAVVNCATFDGTCADGACHARDVFCRLQYPDNVTLQTGQSTTVYDRYYVAGVTDQSRAVDYDPYVIGALGYGPSGTGPDTWPASQWVAATANSGYLAPESGNERNNDELQGELVAPAEGCDVSYAYRMSTDGGRTWTYCDRDTGPGQDGSEDGYQPARAGSLRVIPGPIAIRITSFDIDYSESHPSMTNIGVGLEQELRAANTTGSLNLLLDLKPLAASGRLGLHNAVQVDPLCNRELDRCRWKVPVAGLDQQTCRADVDMSFSYGPNFLMAGGTPADTYLLNGDVPLMRVSFFLTSIQILPDGSIGNVSGSMFAALSQDDFPELEPPGDVDGDGDGGIDEYSIRFAIHGVGGTIVGVTP